ncbi:hypothetical protein NDU88_009291 [Pleurodeles waltl]|uniref:Uncharacterized protein n=1 Tax=Pleurodeles waltl TaxID=8319 RepID=A0AAV7P1W9_PLEWA|nr:hypothetical protein NDU88_009291 [Pleurodeles waltl]
MESPIPGYRSLNQSQLAGIIGETMSALTLPIARILGVFHYPQPACRLVSRQRRLHVRCYEAAPRHVGRCCTCPSRGCVGAEEVLAEHMKALPGPPMMM